MLLDCMNEILHGFGAVLVGRKNVGAFKRNHRKQRAADHQGIFEVRCSEWIHDSDPQVTSDKVAGRIGKSCLNRPLIIDTCTTQSGLQPNSQWVVLAQRDDLFAAQIVEMNRVLCSQSMARLHDTNGRDTFQRKGVDSWIFRFELVYESHINLICGRQL